MKKIRCFLFVVQLLACSLLPGQQRLKFSHIETSMGLSHVDVMNVVQDHHGFMWFATANGLNKYDGNRFTVYRHDNLDKSSLANNYVMFLLQDRAGKLWVGSSGGLQSYDYDKDRFINYDFRIRNLPDSSVSGIAVILEDRNNNLWIGTESNGLIFFDKTKNRYRHYQHEQLAPNSLSNNAIRSIFEDSKQQLWIGTVDGLNLFDSSRQRFSRYQHNESDSRSIGHSTVNAICEDNGHRLWLGTYGAGIAVFDQRGGRFTHLRNQPGNSNSLVNNKISAIAKDNSGNLWIGTENNGMSILDPVTGNFNNQVHSDFDNNSVNDNSFNSIYKDSRGNMWVATFAGGVNLWNSEGNFFNHYKHNPIENSLSNNKVLAIYEDSKNRLWIGTDGGGLNVLDQKTGQFGVYRHDPANRNTICGDNILNVTEDRGGNIWIASWGEGLSVYNPRNKRFTHFRNDPTDNNSLGNNFVRVVYEDRSNNIWVGTSGGGLDLYDPKAHGFIHYVHDDQNASSINNNYVLSIFEDTRGLLWVGTSANGFNQFDKKTRAFSHFNWAGNVFNIAETSNGLIWMATESGLVRYNPVSGEHYDYTGRDGLLQGGVAGILEDDQHNLWISTVNGLCRLDPDNKNCRNFTVEDGLQANHFNEKAYCKSRNGNMYFGGVNGFNQFLPANISEKKFDHPLAITGLQIFNRDVGISSRNKPSPLEKNITETSELFIPYSSSVISFEFAALNFTTPEKKQYSYMLEGFDEEWNNIGKLHNATYTNLDPRRYVFKVRTTNNSGEWSRGSTNIILQVKPPFWMTIWFRAAIVVFLLGSFATFYRIRIRSVRKRENELKQLVTERTRQLAHSIEEEQKARRATDFANEELERKNTELEQFAYIASHDLQEPLRTTSGLVELLQKQYRGKLDEKADKYFTFIVQASDRMKMLISNLLEFSRIGNKKALEQVDCNSVLQDVLDDLGMVIKESGAEVSFSALPLIQGYHTEIKQLFQNLLTNSIKFRNKDEVPRVKISVREAEGYWEFGFSDNGIGIEEKHFDKIFVIFQRLHTRTAYEGTGIGLSHCKKIVELHQGKIWVKSVPANGATFYFTIPQTRM
jgi:ligand-binding sensor domain-containing protein/signal transduction histidine kinase